MKEIGGYFELELPERKEEFIHSDCLAVNSGRHALECILKSIDPKIKKIYLPYYTCDSILQPIKKLGIPFTFYHIDKDFEIKESIVLKFGEYIIVNNYFGIKDKYIKKIYLEFKDKLIVDNTQAWFATPLENVGTFYSPRKFFGVSDGGFACGIDFDFKEIDVDSSYERSSHLLKRIDLGASQGYLDFKENSAQLSSIGVKRMSNLTKRLLKSIDMEWVKRKRLENYEYLDKFLSQKNKIKLPVAASFECPMVYPYMTDGTNLQQKLIQNHIYVATYWPNVFEWCHSDSIEFELAKNIIPLPIDQRYGKAEMDQILNIILS